MGFTFNGISSKQMGIDTRMSVENRIPDIRNNTDAIAGRNGVVDFGQTIGERRIETVSYTHLTLPTRMPV